MKTIHINKDTHPNMSEYFIPNFPCYTIDRNLVVRSYAVPGPPAVLKIHHNHNGGEEYNLWTRDKDNNRVKKSFHPLRLFMCAVCQIDPVENTLSSFKLDENGHYILKFKNNKTPMGRKQSGYMDKDWQIANAVRGIEHMQALIHAADSDDWGRVMELMHDYKELVIDTVCYKCRCSRSDAEEAFYETLEHIVSRMRREHLCVYNFKGWLMKMAPISYIKARKAMRGDNNKMKN